MTDMEQWEKERQLFLAMIGQEKPTATKPTNKKDEE